MITLTIRIAEVSFPGVAIEMIPEPDNATELERLHYRVFDRALLVATQLILEVSGHGSILEEEDLVNRVRAAFNAATKKPPSA